MQTVYTRECILDYAKAFEVDQSDILETFLCSLLGVTADKLYEMLEDRVQRVACKSFIGDAEKMRDFFFLSKADFLRSYSYVDEDEYDATTEYFEWLRSDKRSYK